MKDVKNAVKHLREHQKYPATKANLVATCNELSDFSADDKKWFESHIPEGKYNSAEDIMQALGMNQAAMAM